MNIFKIKKVLEVTGLGRSSLYSMVGAGTFPQPIKLTPRAVGWIDTEVQEWITSQAAKRALAGRTGL
jgi:prophage regulatory protein